MREIDDEEIERETIGLSWRLGLHHINVPGDLYYQMIPGLMREATRQIRAREAPTP